MSNSDTLHSLKFEKTLDKNDYGLIISEEGYLKGIWVPDHLWDNPFPAALVELCIKNYGVDPNEPDPQPRNLH